MTLPLTERMNNSGENKVIYLPYKSIFPIEMKLPAASCGVSSGIRRSQPAFALKSFGAFTLPFIPVASYRVFWRRRIKPRQAKLFRKNSISLLFAACSLHLVIKGYWRASEACTHSRSVSLGRFAGATRSRFTRSGWVPITETRGTVLLFAIPPCFCSLIVTAIP